ncbi:MAG: hypothetical protein Ct9H300mP1_04560 [Planctomycetaceae bacterium]|nr:MAG: hypothetical protein Ct9H300mP1_04560 [Planctomycetaceae bacterium]
MALAAADWRRLCGRTGRAIKVAMLDQSLVAGIGNLYASEILFRAGIDPACPADRIADNEAARLSRAARAVLNEAIRHEGSTLSDGTYRNALNQDGDTRILIVSTIGPASRVVDAMPDPAGGPGPAVDVLLPVVPAVA